MNAKWIWAVILLVISGVAAYVAYEWLSVPIHLLPSYLGQHHGRGHYRKRGILACIIAALAFFGAAYLAFRAMQDGQSSVAATSASSGDVPVGGPDEPVTAETTDQAEGS